MTWSQLAYGLGVYLRGFLGFTSNLASRIFDEIVCGSYHILPWDEACIDMTSLQRALLGRPGKLRAELVACLGLNLTVTLCPSLTI